MSGPAPIRTCIGCRQRDTVTELLRVVVAPDAPGQAPESSEESAVRPVVPDPRRRMAGRGANLHPAQRCVELAVRRRAFARALRVSVPIDPTPVREYVARIDPTGIHPAEPRRR